MNEAVKQPDGSVTNTIVPNAGTQDTSRPVAEVSEKALAELQKLKAELGLETAQEKFAAYTDAADWLSRRKVSDVAADEFVLITMCASVINQSS